MNWKELVRWGGQSAVKVHDARMVVVITDCVDVDDTYHVDMSGLVSGPVVFRARTQRGVDGLLQEFGIVDGGFCQGRM